VKLLADVERNEKGTPLVSSIFELARGASESPLLVYVNADILLLPDIIDAAREAVEHTEYFLVVGQRWDLDVRRILDFSSGWEARLQEDLKARGRMHLPAGSDYFIFPRQTFTEIPRFAIGRAGWDNWMIYHARQQGWLLIDGTPSIKVIHQDHDYSHLPGGKPHYEQKESFDNEELAGGSANLYMVLDCDVQLREGEIKPPPITLVRSLRRAEVWITPQDGIRQGWRWGLARQMRRARRRLTGSL
jgi:hypothetical protein